MAVERNPFEGSKEAVELDEFEEKVEAVTAPDGIEIEIEGEEEITIAPMESEHYANLVSECDDEKLKEIANEVIEGFKTDKDSREEWEETFERGFDLLGLKLSAESFKLPAEFLGSKPSAGDFKLSAELLGLKLSAEGLKHSADLPCFKLSAEADNIMESRTEL